MDNHHSNADRVPFLLSKIVPGLAAPTDQALYQLVCELISWRGKGELSLRSNRADVEILRTRQDLNYTIALLRAPAAPAALCPALQ